MELPCTGAPIIWKEFAITEEKNWGYSLVPKPSQFEVNKALKPTISHSSKLISTLFQSETCRRDSDG
jgi:hypothetical protein